jgi:hypothetical protein
LDSVQSAALQQSASACSVERVMSGGQKHFRAFAYLVVLVVITAACSDPGPGTTGASTDTSAATTTVPATSLPETSAPITSVPTAESDVSQVLSDPVALALVALQQNFPGVGTLITPEEAELAYACVNGSLVDSIGSARLAELTRGTADRSLDLAQLTDTELEFWVNSVVVCDPDSVLLSRLVAVDDSQLAQCILERTKNVDRVDDLIADLVNGLEASSANLVVGFRYGCGEEWLDAQFGDDTLGGTAGEDLRFVSGWFIDSAFPVETLSDFEDVCVLRGTQQILGVDRAWDYLNRAENYREVNVLDYFFEIVPEEELIGIFEEFGQVLLECIEPFDLAGMVTQLAFESPEINGCVRDTVDEEEMKVILASVFVTSDRQGTTSQAGPADKFFSAAIAECATLLGSSTLNG